MFRRGKEGKEEGKKEGGRAEGRKGKEKVKEEWQKQREGWQTGKMEDRKPEDIFSPSNRPALVHCFFNIRVILMDNSIPAAVVKNKLTD